MTKFYVFSQIDQKHRRGLDMIENTWKKIKFLDWDDKERIEYFMILRGLMYCQPCLDDNCNMCLSGEKDHPCQCIHDNILEAEE